MQNKRGARIPPGHNAKQEAVAKLLATMPGYLNYVLVAGVNGMAIRTNFDSEKHAHHAAHHYNALWHQIAQRDPRTGLAVEDGAGSGKYVLYAVINGVEVFFEPAGNPPVGQEFLSL